MFVLNCEQINNVEKEAVKNGDSFLRLMQNAGKSVFDFILSELPECLENVVIVCGKGNNGGDGYVIAELLCNYNVSVSVITACGEPSTDIASFYFNRVKKEKIDILKYDNNNEQIKEKAFKLLSGASLIIDCVFGIGFKGAVRENLVPLFSWINSTSAKKLSVDVPSGLSCDALTPQGVFIKPDYTVTFSALKPVNVLYPTSEYCGRVILKSVGIDSEIIEKSDKVMTTTDNRLLDFTIEPRAKNTNKGSFGRLLCICGKVGMAGAAVFASKSAVRSGVGLVELATVKEIYSIVSSNNAEPIFTLLKASENGTISKHNTESIKNSLKKAKACLIGCGIGDDEDTKQVLKEVLKTSNIPLIIDADALNILSKDIDMLSLASCPVILTPHPGEMARLVNTTVQEVQLNRDKIASDFAKKHGVYLVLKGANTIIADPKGDLTVNLTGNSGMAKGGSGDVLAGIISAFVARGVNIKTAVCAGVYAHGVAGDICADKYSQTAMTPTDMINELKEVFKR